MLTKYFTALLLPFSLFALSLPQVSLAQAQVQTSTSADYSKQLQKIEEKTEARRRELGIPGMSLVIVKDDQIIFIKGLGYKDFEKKIAVTPDTQFAIGSATKAFTGLSVLMSMDGGKLSLEDSPRKALPYFKMYDAETDKNITIRDLLSHSSGLNRTDLAMSTGKLNRAELIQVAAQAKPTGKLREKFQYQNIMFTAAGEIVANVQKTPWEKYVPARIFAPLGMPNSTMSMKQMATAKDYSYGYSYNFDTKETTKLPFRDIDEIAPAGSINSSARDMARWLRFVLSGGAVDGKRLVSEKGFEEWLKPQMKIAGKSSYGFGWFLQDWNGLKVVQHGGNIDGFNAMVAMIPEKKLGFVMLTNVTASSLGGELMPLIWSNLIDLPKSPDSAKLPVKTMQVIAGKYRLASPGVDIEIKIDDKDLVMIVPGQPQSTLEPTGSRQFKPAGGPDGFAVKFTPDEGDATEMHLTQPNGVFTLQRIKADGTVEPKAVQVEVKPTGTQMDLVGRYNAEKTKTIAEIKEVDGKPAFIMPGQPPYSLAEKSKDIYSMSSLPETYYVKVTRDDKDKVAKVVVVQPEGEFGFIPLAPEAKIEITTGQLMQKVIDASGGEANWRKLTTRVTTFDTDMENQGVKASGKAYAKAPGKTATETTMTALGKTIASGWEYFDGLGGGASYTFAPADKYTGRRLDDVRLSSAFYGILDWKTQFKKIDITRFVKVGEDECYAVDFTPNTGSAYTDFYSTKTFLLRKRDGVISSSTSDQKIPYTVTFDDYRDIDGIKVAYRATSYNIGNGNIVTTFKDIKHNVPVDDKLFAPRKVK